MTKEQKISLFREVLEKFETEEIKEYCKDMIGLIPDDCLILPSSTSMKYHNAKQCQIFGNTYHIIIVAEICNYLLGLEHNKLAFSKEKQRDCMRVGAILHDAIKLGFNGSQYSLFNHPELAAEWIKTTVVPNDIKDELKNYIAGLVASHSGEWNTSNRSKQVLKKPETPEQKFIHECDYLGSRANIDMSYSKELENTIKELTDDLVDTYTLSYGKYKGETVSDVFYNNEGYFEYFESKEGLKEPVKTIIERLRKSYK